ncbi:TPA: hypothetical protein N2D99_002184 [Clostridium botulinum]|nr:hypothetical protein [Clostridium botulinum]
MNKYNALGVDLINYKIELLKDYPEIVKRSLIASVDQMLQNNLIDLDTHYAVKDYATLVHDFKEYLLTKSAYLKTTEELFSEYEALREKLTQKILDLHIDEQLATESFVDKEKIEIIKSFNIDIEYVKTFFGVEHKDIDKLMKRKGFVEKFAVLRLPKILRDFIKTIEYPDELFICDASLVYYDVETNSYCIDLLFDIPVENLEDEEKLSNITLNVKDIVMNAIEFYKSKTLV